MLKNRRERELSTTYAEVLSAGSISPRYSLETSLAAMSRLGVEETVRLLRRHKVRGLISQRLSAYPDSAVASAVVEQLAPNVARLVRLRAELPSTLAFLADLGVELGIGVGVFKGVAARQWYADPDARDFGDLDLCLRSFSDAQRLASALRDSAGYMFHPSEHPWLKRRLGDGPIYGQILLEDVTGERMALDIHFGGYSVRHCAHLDIAVPDEPGLHYLEPAQNLAAMINNAAGDHFVSMKDVNDLLIGSAQFPDDLSRAFQLAADAKLDSFASVLVALVAETSSTTPAQDSVLSQAARRFRAEPDAPTRTDSWTRRWVATAIHAFRVGRARSLRDGVALAVDAAQYYRKRMSLQVVDDAGDAPGDIHLDQHTCLKLVPLHLLEGADTGGTDRVVPGRGTVLADELRVISTAAGPLISIRDEVFVPTVTHRVPRDLVHAAQALVTSRAADD